MLMHSGYDVRYSDSKREYDITDSPKEHGEATPVISREFIIDPEEGFIQTSYTEWFTQKDGRTRTLKEESGMKRTLGDWI